MRKKKKTKQQRTGGVILIFPSYEERNPKTQKTNAPELRNSFLEDV